MSTTQKAIKQAIEVSSQIDDLQIRKSLAEQEHNKAIKHLNDEIAILRGKLSTLLAIADQ